MIKPISKNKLKFVRHLQQKKFRRQHHLYLISGLRAVQEALTASTLEVEMAIIEERHLPLLNQLPRLRTSAVYSAGEQEFKQIVEEKTPQGIALVVRNRPLSFTKKHFSRRMLFLDRISDPGNLGTILRSAHWFGWQTVLIGQGSVDPFQPKAVRASVGSVVHLKIIDNVSPENFASLGESSGYRLLGSAAEKGQPLEQFTCRKDEKCVVALGSEAHGLSSEIQNHCEALLTIPGPGGGESLNIAMAATIFLYHFYLVERKEQT